MVESEPYLKEYKVEEFDCIQEKGGELGAGGFGTVLLASHRVLRNVALKCFAVTGGDNEKEQVAQEMKKELEMLQKANHDNILRVHGWTQWPGSMALVMEYMPGGNLRRLLRDPRIKLSPALRLSICCDVAKALTFIHNQYKPICLTHGDVKPENVLLSADLNCKLGDFGSAKVSASTTTARESASESSAITLDYAAPERLNANQKPKTEQDTYSFGLIVHMVLTRNELYEGYTNRNQYIEGVKKGQRPMTDAIDQLKESLTSSRDRRIVETLESVMKRCWHQTPSERPKMIQIRDELQELINEINQGDLMEDISTATNSMKIFIPNKASARVPLKFFNTRERGFSSGKHVQTSVQQDAFQMAAADSASQALLQETAEHEESEGNASSNRFSDGKPTMDELFGLQGQASLSSDVQTAPDLLKKYKTSLKNQNFAKAETFKTRLVSKIVNQVDTNAKDVRLFGEKLLKEKKHLKSIAIFEAAATLFSKLQNTEGLERIMWCVYGMYKANIAIIDDANMKVVVKEYVIPLMRKWSRHMQNTSQVSVKWRCLQVSWVLHYIEWSECLVDQWKLREKTLRGAVTEMRNVFGNDVNREHGRLFGALLNNLGHVCHRASRFEEAASLFQESLDAKRAANDYVDEKKRERDIARSKKGLKDAKLKMM